MRVCMLGLSQMTDAWPIARWILRVFENISNKPPNKTSIARDAPPLRAWEAQENYSRESSRFQQNQVQDLHSHDLDNATGPDAQPFNDDSNSRPTQNLPVDHSEYVTATQNDQMFAFGPGIYNTNLLSHPGSPFWGDFNLSFTMAEQLDHHNIPNVNFDGEQAQYIGDIMGLNM